MLGDAGTLTNRAVTEQAPRRLVSLILPVHNEEENVVHAYEELCAVFDRIGTYDVEFIFTDNHSDDGTFRKLEQLGARDARVKVLRFNRNYGFQRSLLTGYRYASGDAAVQIDCDLQDPPSLIPQFLVLWEQGHDVVVGLRRRRQENFLLVFGRRTFYALLNRISEEKITSDAGDFRLVDRTILDHLRRSSDLHPYVRGLIASLAGNETGIPYDRAARTRGQSKFPLLKLVRFGLEGIISHSILPLRLATYIGLALSVLTFLLCIFYVVSALMFGADWPPGFATTTVLILLGMSLNAIFMGVMGEYISRIYQQVRQRPLTLIERTINIDQRQD
ncbi:MAG: glycosyltransferase [Proteobacteria bacterium]|nr:MAG: glycosyltransferase [Pseudomonadota bacterium]